MSDNQKDNKKDVRDDKSTKLSVFNSFPELFTNTHHTYLSRKLERLTSALYVITGFLPQEEPVRNRLRTCALDLIHRASDPSALFGEGVEAFRSQAAEIGVLLQTAHSAGLISRMNSELLCEEYAKAATFVRQNAPEIRISSFAESVPEVSSIGQDNLSDKTPASKNSVFNTPKGQKVQIKRKGQKTRREMILELLNKKDKISVKEASNALPDCSEKTVQRELVSLVRDGLAIKEGERRWSTYRRVQQVVSSAQ